MKILMTMAVAILLIVSFSHSAVAETDFMALGTVTGQSFNAEFAGTTATGTKFEIKPDGSGKLSADGDIWETKCETDAMTDANTCYLDWYWPALIQFQFSPGMKVRAICATNTSLMVGRPMFRVNSRSPVTAGRGGCLSSTQSAALLSQLTLGAILRVRTLHLDEGGTHTVDVEATVSQNFAEALEMVQFLFDRKDRSIAWPKQP